jgi:hypothetical protein
MARGFIVLPDGRCFSRQWAAHDIVLRAVAEEVAAAAPLRGWLLEQLPGPDDEQNTGIGNWVRKSDQTIIERFIDLRLMTVENQGLFCDAVKRAALVPRDESWLKDSLCEFADMISRMERGEPPLSKSHWISVVPSEGPPIGPGCG